MANSLDKVKVILWSSAVLDEYWGPLTVIPSRLLVGFVQAKSKKWVKPSFILILHYRSAAATSSPTWRGYEFLLKLCFPPTSTTLWRAFSTSPRRNFSFSSSSSSSNVWWRAYWHGICPTGEWGQGKYNFLWYSELKQLLSSVWNQQQEAWRCGKVFA